MVLHDKDKIHILEGAVITWTRQIKDVLKADSESALKVRCVLTQRCSIAACCTFVMIAAVPFDSLCGLNA